ncbi:MAG: DNA cytosine methyltransferase [Pseudomonadota bacterium]
MGNNHLVSEEARSERKVSRGPAYKMIDLFCGAGGMTLGFSEAFHHSFKPVWANDLNLHAVGTYNINFENHCILGDIVDILNDGKTKIPRADVVIGGPPCQGFSLLNKNRDGDSRKQLWIPFLEIVDRSEASIFVMENVPQLLGSPEFLQLVDKAREYGFKIVAAKLSAADYGVSQLRQRAFIVGCKFLDPSEVFPPPRTHFNPTNGFQYRLSLDRKYVPKPSPWVALKDVIGDLPLKPVGTEIRDVPPPLDLHFGRNPTPLSMKRYEAIPNEGMNRFDLQAMAPDLTPDCWIRKKTGGTDLFGRLWWDRPAFTIRTEFYKPEKGRYLHPQEHRPITHREAARIQSFPDSFRFVGAKIEIARQIGNAVPPLLAARVADCVESLLDYRCEGNG